MSLLLSYFEPITNDHIDDDASIQSNDEPYQSSSSEYVSSSYSSSHKGDEDDYANLRKELILANSTLCDEPSTKMLPNLPVSPVELACQLQEVPKSMKSPVFPLQICDKFQIPDNSSDSEIETTAYVNRAKKTISGSRVYDKRHACYFCDKLIGIVTRHLELVHFKEIEVAKLLTMDKNSERRIEGFLCLLRAGDYYDNCQILAMKKEPFWLAQCTQDILESSGTPQSIKWLERVKVRKAGTIYTFGAEDKILVSSIIFKEPITNDHIDDDASIQSNDEPYQSSSSEYVPSSYSSSHEGDEDDYANLRKELILANSTLCDEPSTKMLSNLPVSPLELACQLQEVPKSMKSLVFPLQICDKFQIPDNSSDSEIETTAYVNRAKKTISGSRVYDKRHACYFCDKLIGTVTRHLELVHFKEIEVAKLLTMDKNSERRKEGSTMYRLVVVALLILLSSLEVLSEESYDEDPLLFLEPYSSRYSRSRSESILPLMDDLESEYDDDDQFARPTRSQDKNDNFVRFGRGNSDFIRFGRDPYKYNREMRGNDQNFLRFGRSVDSNKKRSKRSVEAQNKRGSDNFLRFGKSGDDSFIRYGRNKNEVKKQIDDLYPLPTVSHPFVNRFGSDPLLYYPMILNEKLLHRFPLLQVLKKLEDEVRQSH
ncbi:hypothetical protein RN001_003424 [Aquatica leii]|uniref:Uncharacterized protein n=1 Tax=Aquatica leii TaxID=1421715 RepID=A0AAN7PIJ7_9COLE|nr:hypothetical protein RN001_003424 [Aquatica leii]